MHFLKLQNKLNWNYAFIAFLILFICCKIPYLNMAYFWDECWSYVPALRKMSETNISLLPGAIDTFNYRGHPLLYYALGGAWLKLFGTSFIAFHTYGLVYGIALLIIVFLFLKKNTNIVLAFFSVLVLATQGFFIIQSSTVLPEVAVSFWVLLSYYFLLQNKWVGYFISATCLLLTKESGLVIIPAILVAYSIWNLFNKEDSIQKWFINSIIICLPVLPLGLFFLLQYYKFGWAFFPEHIGFIDYRLEVFLSRISSFCNYLFIQDFHFAFSAILVLSFLYTISKSKFLFYSQIPKPQKKAISYMLFFVLFYFIFSAINFFTLRYLISPLILLLLFFCMMLANFLPKYCTIIMLSISIFVFINFAFNKELGENKLGMYDSIAVCEKGVKWVEKNIANTSNKIRVDDFIVGTQLLDYRAGFRTTKDSILNIVGYVPFPNQYIVISSMSENEKHALLVADKKSKLIKKFVKNQAWYEIWQTE